MIKERTTQLNLTDKKRIQAQRAQRLYRLQNSPWKNHGPGTNSEGITLELVEMGKVIQEHSRIIQGFKNIAECGTMRDMVDYLKNEVRPLNNGLKKVRLRLPSHYQEVMRQTSLYGDHLFEESMARISSREEIL